MIRYENECCDCASPAYPCIGEHCARRRTPHYYCDECKEEFEDIYEYEDAELCIGCIEQKLTKVKGE